MGQPKVTEITAARLVRQARRCAGGDQPNLWSYKVYIAIRDNDHTPHPVTERFFKAQHGQHRRARINTTASLRKPRGGYNGISSR